MEGELLPARPAAAPSLFSPACGRGRGGGRGCIILPAHARGMRIGLFGGTFDPPHAAHRAASLLALRRLDLDRVWWLVTPGNPLKDIRGLAPLAERVAAARALAHHPRIDVSDFEANLGTNYTYGTISYLVRRCPGVRFVWIMGADNLRHFHRWQRWYDIAALVPIAIVDRLGPSLYASAGVAGQALGFARLPESAAMILPATQAPSLDLPARPRIAAIVDGAARGTRLAARLNAKSPHARWLKLLPRRAYLSERPGFGGRGRHEAIRNLWSERIRNPVHSCNLSGRTSRARNGLQNAS